MRQAKTLPIIELEKEQGESRERCCNRRSRRYTDPQICTIKKRIAVFHAMRFTLSNLSEAASAVKSAFTQEAVVVAHGQVRFHLTHRIERYPYQNQQAGTAEK